MFDNLFFEPMNFVSSLEWMGKGMLGIFVVIGIIICATALLNKLSSGKKAEKVSRESKTPGGK